eukprot:a509241_255.p1 GENE.a509241_255~~a509241_255.p1  ORF type:complete len:252 (+),score=34.29 a509241_255:33-758(+)
MTVRTNEKNVRTSQRSSSARAAEPRASETRNGGSGGSRDGGGSRGRSSRPVPVGDEWRTTLCDLCPGDPEASACEACMCAFCSPCFSVVRSSAWTDGREPEACDWLSGCSMCFTFFAAPMCAPIVCLCICGFACQTRSRMGERFDLEDTSVLPVICCLPFALAQHDRELHLRGATDPSRRRHRAADRNRSRREPSYDDDDDEYGLYSSEGSRSRDRDRRGRGSAESAQPSARRKSSRESRD